MNQPLVVKDLAQQLASGSPHAQNITGVMIESNLRPGRQDVPPETEGGASALKYGVSITDACVDYEMTRGMLDELNEAVRSRREARVAGAFGENALKNGRANGA